MLYEIAHFVQNKLPWLWDCVEWGNAMLCAARYDVQKVILQHEGVRIAEVCDAHALSVFFSEQPEDSFRWFKPHKFDEQTMASLLRRKSYIIYIVEDEGKIAGYAFLRCFFNGKCFLGKMVDSKHQGKGICTKLCAEGMNIASQLGMRMYESINKENVGSMKASQKACKVVVVEELKDGDLLIEDFLKEKV